MPLLQRAAAIIFLLLVWQGASMLSSSELLLPSPRSVLLALVSLGGTGSFYASAAISLLRILCGYLLGIAVGVLIGVLSTQSKAFSYLMSPIMSVIRATPVSSFIILVLLWLTNGLVPIFTAFLIVVPIISGSVQEGITSADKGLIEMADFYGMSKLKKLRMIFVSSIFPRLAAACVTSLGFAWKAGVAAEVLATPDSSIGKGLYQSKIYLETAELFAWTLVVILLSIILERLISLLLERLGNGGVRRK